MFGNDSRALSGRFLLFAILSQGIALLRSALGFILAARRAAVQPSHWNG
jgi:hypothetical protein